MLDRILPDFHTQFRTEPNEALIVRTLAAENERLLDADHLESQVIGKGEFPWDFRCLKPGFWNLVEPFTRDPSGGSHLLLLALDELGVGGTERLALIPIIEYSHFASLVNDHYNLHPALNRPVPDRFEAAKLTQLKYAAQFMVVYPKYLVLRNRMAVGQAQRNALHAAMFQLTVMAGTSRALFQDWSRRGFAGVTRAHTLQWSVYTLAGYFLGPIQFACILAGVDDARMTQLKSAFGWLTVAAKLDFERRVIHGLTTAPDEVLRQPAFRVDSFPATYWIDHLQRLGRPPAPAEPFPDFAKRYDDALAGLRPSSGGSVAARDALMDEALEKFHHGMGAANLLPALSAKLAAAYQTREDHSR